MTTEHKNIELNYDPIALSMINSFWEQPQYSVPELPEQQNYYGQRYNPYNCTNQKIVEQQPVYDPYPYNSYYYNPQYQVYYQVPSSVQHDFHHHQMYYPQVQPAQVTSYYNEPSPPQSTTLKNEYESFGSSESFCSVESRPESDNSLDATITIVDTPPTELYKIQIPDNLDDLPPVDEKVLKEALEIIDISSLSSPNSSLGSFAIEVLNEPVIVENQASTKKIKKVKVPKTPKSASNKPYTPPNTEDETRRYNCIACGKFFLNRPGLRKHFRTKVHKDVVAKTGIEDPVKDSSTWEIGEHKCFVCGKKFGKYTDMIDHVVTH